MIQHHEKSSKYTCMQSTELTDQQLVFSQTALMHACTEQCLLTRDRHQTFLCKEGLHLSDGLLVIIVLIIFLVGGGGGARGQETGRKGGGRLQEAGEEGTGSGIPKVVGSGRKRGKLCNIAQYFTIEKMQRGGSQQIQGGNRD